MEQNKNLIFGLWFTVIIFLLVLAIKGLGNALIPLSLSIILSYLFFPLIWALEKRGVKRTFSSLVVFISGIALMLLFSFLVIPPLSQELKEFVLEFPLILGHALEKMEILLGHLSFIRPLQKQALIGYAKNYFQNISLGNGEMITAFIRNSFPNIVSSLINLFNFLLIPIFTFHLLKDYEGIVRKIQSLIPTRWQPLMEIFFKKANVIISGHIRGQIIVGFILSILYSIGFNLIGLKFGTLVGMLTGFLNIIPYIGPVIGFSLAILMALPNFSGSLFLGIVFVFLLLQCLEGILITPMILGKKVGLGILEIILSIIIGGNWGGILGMMMAVPCAAVLKIILGEAYYHYKKSSFYNSHSKVVSLELDLIPGKSPLIREVRPYFQ